MRELPYSIHTFMFPFSWNTIVSNKTQHSTTYSERTKLSDFHKHFSKCKTLSRKTFKIDKDSENYNEYTYFHEFVRHSIYDTGRNDNLDKVEMLYYDLDGNEGDYFQIKQHDKLFNLTIDNICLHVFSTGIGILSYNLSNFNHRSKEEVLIINEYGRRIYPQYIGNNWEYGAAKNSFLATSISGKIGSKLEFHEDFSAYKDGLKVGSTFIPPSHISSVFTPEIISGRDKSNSSFVYNDNNEKEDMIRINKLTDDRMFYLCYLHDDSLANSLGDSSNKSLSYYKSSFWYAFVCGDASSNDITIKNNKLMKQHISNFTYTRWAHTNQIDKELLNEGLITFEKSSTIYGVTRDSFVCIGGWDTLFKHMQTMYYQMAVLCLAQRCSVLRFSSEVGKITNLLEDNEEPMKAIKDLYKNYIQFINKLFFREVTSQIQGIELYTKFHQAMNIEKDVKDLDGEIQELHTYVSMVEQSNLSKVAIWFLPAGVIAGILGMNVFDEKNFRYQTDKLDFISISWIVLVILMSIGSVWLVNKFLNKKMK